MFVSLTAQMEQTSTVLLYSKDRSTIEVSQDILAVGESARFSAEIMVAMI